MLHADTDPILTSPDDPVARTIAAYNCHAQDYIARTAGADMSAFHDRIASRFFPGDRLLDVGSGSGRDALALTAKGFMVDVLEPSEALLDNFMAREPSFPGHAYRTTVCDASLPRARYDGIYACASLLHVPLDQWADALANLHGTLKPGGKLFVIVKQEPSGYDPMGRWFTGFDSLVSLVSLVEKTGNWRFVEGEASPDSLGRPVTFIEAWFVSTEISTAERFFRWAASLIKRLFSFLFPGS